MRTTYTDSGGVYTFTGLFAENYRISYLLPANYLARSASVGTLGGNIVVGNQGIDAIPVGFDQNGESYDFMLEAVPQQIGGVVYKVDPNGNFLAPASGVVIYLHDLAQTVIFSTAQAKLLKADLLQSSDTIST
ncbi:hypothetical protein FACS1894176_06280 [Bacteroidia bacterium]|nr:hypothetical protein FACS1894176_06280 [Bacteroidia bacterium]